ncbi:hypothetical protein [Nitrospira sp. Nam80]
MRTVSARVGTMVLLSGCADGRWAHPLRTESQTQQDWDMCRAEVLAGHEQKETMGAAA